jgi:hypothetical protein
MPDHEIIVRPARSEDAVDLHENCFSANTLAEVQERIAESIKAAEKDTQVLLIAEVGGMVVGTTPWSGTRTPPAPIVPRWEAWSSTRTTSGGASHGTSSSRSQRPQ